MPCFDLPEATVATDERFDISLISTPYRRRDGYVDAHLRRLRLTATAAWRDARQRLDVVATDSASQLGLEFAGYGLACGSAGRSTLAHALLSLHLHDLPEKYAARPVDRASGRGTIAVFPFRGGPHAPTPPARPVRRSARRAGLDHPARPRRRRDARAERLSHPHLQRAAGLGLARRRLQRRRHGVVLRPARRHLEPARSARRRPEGRGPRPGRGAARRGHWTRWRRLGDRRRPELDRPRRSQGPQGAALEAERRAVLRQPQHAGVRQAGHALVHRPGRRDRPLRA